MWLRSGIAAGAAGFALVAAGLVAQTGVQQDGRRGVQQNQPGQMSERPDHIMLNTDELEWKEAPPSLPDGAEVAIMEGNPSASGPFTMRLKMPADYEIPAHTHPGIEHVTVISGVFHMGAGDELDKSSGKELKRGGFAVMAVGTEHYAWTGDEETVVQLHGMAPWGIYYLDPAKDPRNDR